MSELSAAARNVNWLVENFVDRVPGVKKSVVVSAEVSYRVVGAIQRQREHVIAERASGTEPAGR